MDRGYVERNRASAERLDRLIRRLTDEQMSFDAGGGWTVAALLAHLAFWDRSVLLRWKARRDGELTPADVPGPVTDLVNDAAMPAWRSLQAGAVRNLVRSSAAETDAIVAGLPDDVLAAVEAEGRPRLLDRSLHRTEHIEMIERVLQGETATPS